MKKITFPNQPHSGNANPFAKQHLEASTSQSRSQIKRYKIKASIFRIAGLKTKQKIKQISSQFTAR